MRNFETYFNRHIPEIGSDYLFGSDSTFYRDFFSDDFFEKQFIHQNEFMLKMIQEMDSVKNEFFQIHSQNMKI